MSLPAVFFMDGCQPLPISSIRCHFLVYSHFSVFFPPPPAIYLLMNSVSQARFCLPTLSLWFLFFGGRGQGQGVMEPSLACWRSGTKVGQGDGRPGRQTVCVRRTMPALQSASSVLSAKQTLHFPLGLVAFAFFSGPIKVRRAGADKESFISHLNNENPNRSAASARPSPLYVRPSDIFSAWKQSCHGAFNSD